MPLTVALWINPVRLRFRWPFLIYRDVFAAQREQVPWIIHDGRYWWLWKGTLQYKPIEERVL